MRSRRASIRRWSHSNVGWARSRRERWGVFRDVLSDLMQRIDGSVAASLIGLDGIAIETLGDRQVPLDALGAEFGSFVKSIRHANTELDTGDVLQFALV